VKWTSPIVTVTCPDCGDDRQRQWKVEIQTDFCGSCAQIRRWAEAKKMKRKQETSSLMQLRGGANKQKKLIFRGSGVKPGQRNEITSPGSKAAPFGAALLAALK